MPESLAQPAVEESPRMPTRAFGRLVAPELEQVEERLLRLCGEGDDPLSVAARSAVQAGGKRLRPTLVLLSARAVGEPAESTIALAIAVETMHVASLMHDDVVDGAETRRGQPAARELWGNRTAVLVGDYLGARAYYELTSLRDTDYVETFAEVGMGMCRAEVEASSVDATRLTEEDCIAVARGKTAGLIGASCEVGALSAGGTAEAATLLREYGERIGIAFQITDDLLDIYGREETIGKSPGRDLLNGQYTLPIVCALRGEQGEQVEHSIGAFVGGGGRGEDLAQLGALVELAGGRAAAELRAREEIALARDALARVEDGREEALEALLEIGDYVLARRY